MINTKHLLKVSAAWVNIVYVVCFFGVAMIPGIRGGFMMYGLHAGSFTMGSNMATFGTFFSGLIIWNSIATAAVWLFAVLYNGIKK